jgi:transposase InsO family protein
MCTAGIRGRAPKRWRKTTIADPAAALRVDRIRRDFTADAAKVNVRWCGDITYIGTWEGWLYLATVIGIASRRIVGYAIADHLRTELVSAALANAVAARDPAPGVIFHADRGCQYTSTEFAVLADGYAVTLSHGRTGQCWDNAVIESWHSTLEFELRSLEHFATRAAARVKAAAWIEDYNTNRRHSACQMMSPVNYEKTLAA